MSDTAVSKTSIFLVTTVGLVLFLIGLFAAVRTVINLASSGNRYPTEGVLSIGAIPVVSQTENDCTNTSSSLYYATDGTVRDPLPAELRQTTSTQASCLQTVADQRQTAKTHDIATSVFYLLLGTGLLTKRRWLAR